jgi:AcrR family transcriptional regulator
MKDSKKGTIMAHSKDLFERFGYQKTTISDIARSMGNVKSAIYYYFSGKEEIFAALVRSEARHFLDQLKAGTNQSEDPIEQLNLYVNTRLDLMQKVSTRYHFLKDEFFQLMPIVEKNRKECDAEEIVFLAEIIQRSLSVEDRKTTDPAFTAQFLMQSLKGLEVQMFVTDQMQLHNTNRKAFVAHILHGLHVFNTTI